MKSFITLIGTVMLGLVIAHGKHNHAKGPYDPTYKGICGVHVTDVPAGGTFTCYDKDESMLCNCQALVLGGRYRCCSKVEGCSSADDFDYYEGTSSVKSPYGPTYKGICGVHVTDVPQGGRF